MTDKRIYLYDSSLRAGGQPGGGEFSSADKLAIAEALDGLGIDYIEAGQADLGSVDDGLFAAAPKYSHARLVALFHMLSPGESAAGDPALTQARASGAPIVSLAGTASQQQVRCSAPSRANIST